MYSGDVGARSRLRHILESAEFLRTRLDGLTLDQFMENRTLVLASLHSLLIGERHQQRYPMRLRNCVPISPGGE